MSTPEFEVHRALVISSDKTTGKVEVLLPAILGSSTAVSIPTSGLTKDIDGYWHVPSVGSNPFVGVSFDRTKFFWLGTLSHERDLPSTTSEPIGHEDRTKSLMSFSNATRTFTIEPADDSYAVWCKGWRYIKTAPESVTIPNTTGLYYISFNSSGELQYTTSFFVWDQETPTSYIYWNSVTAKAEFFADERHGITMDWQTHEYLHRTRGAAIASGFAASNFDVATQNGNTDAQAQLDIANGTFFDEDLQVDVVHSATPTANTWEQDLQGPARIPVFYRSGTGWVMDSPTDFPVKKVTTHPGYNSSSAGSWSVTQLGTNTYGIQWIVATNQLNYPVLSIMGQEQYSNIGQAEAATWTDMDMSGLPIFEIRLLYKIILRATGTNTPGCYFVEIDDYRTALANATSTAAAVVDHGNLTGLSDDDHTQYLLASGSRTATSLTVSGNLTVDTNTFYVGATANKVGIGTIFPSAELDVVGNTELNGQLQVTGEVIDGSSRQFTRTDTGRTSPQLIQHNISSGLTSDADARVTITFTEAFSGNPTVVATRASTGTNQLTAQVYSVSTTQVVFTVLSNDVTQPSTGSISIHWIAIGAKTI